jgi:hypothetical protein
MRTDDWFYVVGVALRALELINWLVMLICLIGYIKVQCD